MKTAPNATLMENGGLSPLKVFLNFSPNESRDNPSDRDGFLGVPLLQSPTERGAASYPICPGFEDLLSPVSDESEEHMKAVLASVRRAISLGIQPLRIHKGSSGSYFCRNESGTVVGVFKPKNEEPYGKMNPKWTKWLHKQLFPCCFGRSCLIPNQGYISEAAASALDRRLGLHITPRTEVVELASPAFYYSMRQRRSTFLKAKVGSFQLFLKGFKDAEDFLLGERLLQPPSPAKSGSSSTTDASWPVDRQMSFRLGFERLCALDYLMRNTDRTLDNWMVCEDKVKGTLKIAAIDNGLAFPYKHPDRWRSYPYGWTFLSMSRVAFSRETQRHLLSKLTDESWWDVTLSELEKVFKVDENFDPEMWTHQRAVIRGQGYNLVYVLELSDWLHAQLELQADTGRLEWPVDRAEQEVWRTQGLFPVEELVQRLSLEASPYGLTQLPPLAVYDETEVEKGRDLKGAKTIPTDREHLIPKRKPQEVDGSGIPPQSGFLKSASPTPLSMDSSRTRKSQSIPLPPKKRPKVQYLARHTTDSGQVQFVHDELDATHPPANVRSGYRRAKRHIVDFAKQPWFSWC